MAHHHVSTLFTKKNKFSHGIRVKGNEGKGLPIHMDSI